MVFLSIYCFIPYQIARVLERYVNNYKMKFNSIENDLLNKYLIYLTNLKINNFKQYQK